MGDARKWSSQNGLALPLLAAVILVTALVSSHRDDVRDGTGAVS